MDDNTDTEIALDETDLTILERVEQNSDVSLESLAAELDLSKSAVHYRLNKLKENGVITSVSADVDPLAIGLNMLMITDVSVSHDSGYATDIGEALADIDGVYQLYYTMGDVDFTVLSRVQNREQMNDLIDDIVAIDGVNHTSSKFVMKELKTGNETVANMSDEMIENVLQE
ncbi:Lrp/AsnC family transcriptional regulator [Natronorubrum halophilum]|uniref:Lrp/AsnC family transcriptional regulator n=1 Tax=Natronorubrum halophilum TaxID=1702106 RepID=UPI000EF752F9|nr:Lrp/AsnC family transcriptional regulator [Natronorubrum halophilum]